MKSLIQTEFLLFIEINTLSDDPNSTPSIPTNWFGVTVDVFLTLQKRAILIIYNKYQKKIKTCIKMARKKL